MTTAAVSAQFTDPYNGVGRSVRSTPLPIVVMKYEPNTPFSHERFCLFGRSGNDVIQVYKDRGSTWHKRIQIAFGPGIAPADDPVPFRNPEGSVASLFVLGTNGVIYQSTQRRYDDDEQWSTFTALPSNVAMASSCAAVNTPDGNGVSAFAVGRDGYLYNIFYSRPASRWGSWSRVLRSPRLVGRPVAVNSSDGLTLHILATDTNGAVQHVRFVRGGQGGWSTWTTLPGSGFLPSPGGYVLGSLLSVFVTRNDGRVYQAIHANNSWSAWSSLGTGSTGLFTSGPAAVNAPNESTLEVVARTSAGAIEQRVYTRGGGGWSGWTALTTGTLSSGVTMANWHTRTSTTAQTRAELFGATDSVAHWFDENSFGKHRVREAFISHWLTMPDDPNTSVDESSYEYFHGPDNAGKARLMIGAFEQFTGFRFADYDTNPRDGVVSQDELMVLWLYPGEGARVRGVGGCISAGSVCVSLAHGLPRAAAHIGPEIITEELCHAAFALDDLYETSDLPNYIGPGRLSMMSHDDRFPHLHPWGKLKLGWVSPTIVRQDGWYPLRPIEQQQDLLVVHDARRGPDDYFLVENRWPNGSVEHALPDRGVAVWRIGEHYEGASHWGRRTIKLLRAGGGREDSVAFFDGGDPRTSYHLTPSSAPADTRWDDGTSSDIAFYHFPQAGSNALVFVDVPPLRARPPAPYRRASYGYIDQRSPYRNQDPTWLTAQTMPVLGQNLVVRVPASFGAATFFLGTGFSSPNVVNPFVDGYLFSSLELVTPAPFGSPGAMTSMALQIPNDANLSGLSLYQQVIRFVAGQQSPLGVSRGGHAVLGY